MLKAATMAIFMPTLPIKARKTNNDKNPHAPVKMPRFSKTGPLTAGWGIYARTENNSSDFILDSIEY